MWFLPSKLLEPLQQRVVYPFGAKLIDEFVVVNRSLFSIAGDGALDVPGSHYLFVLGG